MKSDPESLRILAISSCNYFENSIYIEFTRVFIISIVQFSRYLFKSFAFSFQRRATYLLYHIFKFLSTPFLKFFKISFDVMLSLKSGNSYIISYFQAFVKHFFQPFFECPFSRSIDSNHFVVSCSPLLESLFIIS